MKISKNKKNMQKIIILISILLLFNFITPNYSQASVGGVLLSPVTAIVASIGDAINHLLSTLVIGSDLFPSEDSDIYISDETRKKEFLADPENAYVNNLPDVEIYEDDDLLGDYGLPNIKLSAAEIFSNKIALLDANYFGDEATIQKKLGADQELSSILQLKVTVASWYNKLRQIAVIGLLCVLLYVGIRIIMSSTASDKSKYKSMFLDWVIALCLIFFLHYIMAFTMIITDSITTAIVGTGTTSKQINIIIKEGSRPSNFTGTIRTTSDTETGEKEKTLHGGGGRTIDQTISEGDGITVDQTISGGGGITVNQSVVNQAINNEVARFSTNLIGYMRLAVEQEGALAKLSATIMYLLLTFFTAYFIVKYLQRLLTLTFLTIIAPLVALTYPLDKIRDGKAQAFDYWLKEYMINALLQPIHLLIYTILVTSAIDLSVKSPIYAIVALAFIVPAEKLVKNMFGIRSETAPQGGGFAGGALAAQAINSLGGKNGKKGSGKDSGEKAQKIRTAPDAPNDVSALAAGDEGVISPPQPGDEGFIGPVQPPQPGDEGFIGPVPPQPGDEGFVGPVQPGNGGGSSTNNTENRASRAIRRISSSNFGQAVGRRYVAAGGASGIAKKVGKRVGRMAIKGAIGGATGLVAGSVGLAAGLVSGNLGDAIKGAGAGLTAGTYFGNKAANSILEGGRIGNFIGEVKHGGENEVALAKQRKDIITDSNLRKEAKAKHPEWSNKDVTKHLGVMAEYKNAGVQDTKMIERAMELEKDYIERQGLSQDVARKKAQYTAKLAEDSEFKNAFSSPKRTKELKEGLQAQLENKQISKDKAKNISGATMEDIRKLQRK